MAMSAAERKRRSRQKQKLDDPEKVRQQQKLRMRRYRESKKLRERSLSPMERMKLRKQRQEQERERKRKQRSKFKENKIRLGSRYRSKSAKAKAVNKVKSALPATPRKQKEIIRRLATDFDLIEGDGSERKSSNSIEHDTVEKVIRFYQDDSISYAAPGRKDHVTFRDSSGEKSKIQKRYLKYKLSECFEIFKESYPGAEIGLSRFCGLRPNHVLTSLHTPLTSCLCQTHENFRLLSEALGKVDKRFQKLGGPERDQCVCDSSNGDCWMQECEVCRDGKGLQKYWRITERETLCHKDEIVQYMTWKIDDNGYLNKVSETCSAKELLDKTITHSGPFLKHCYINKQQTKFFKEDKEFAQMDDTVAVIQIDFAENFTCIPQDEVQSSYWSRPQVTLFTAVIWQKNLVKSMCVCSDTRNHTKNEVYVFLNEVLKTISPTVKFVKIWSDGPSSQFRNRFTAVTMRELSRSFHINIQWNFFCAGHGKGAVDGIGGTVKRSVYDMVKNRRAQILDAKGFIEAFQTLQSKIKLICVTKEKIEDELTKACMIQKFAVEAPLVGISYSHLIQLENGMPILQVLRGWETKNQGGASCCSKAGSWVAVIYDNSFVIGEIISGSDYGRIKINFMESCGMNRFKWPVKKDTDTINHSGILCHTVPPNLHSSTGRIMYALPQKEYTRINDLYHQSV